MTTHMGGGSVSGMRLPNSEVTVTVNCGDAIHDVTLRDGAFVAAAHNIGDLHLERVAYGFDPTFEMCGCASLLHALSAPLPSKRP